MVVSTDGSILRMDTVKGIATSKTTETSAETSGK